MGARLLLTATVLALSGAAPARDSEPLLAPVRCVSDYLEALAAAAPPRPARARPREARAESELLWARLRPYLTPRTAADIEATGRPQLLAPTGTLGHDVAFLGYELLAARRAPRGAAVVVSRERTERAVGATPSSAACAYLVGKVSGVWRIADKRCGRDFSNGEVASNYAGYWDEPQASDAGQPVDDWFGEGLE